MRHAGGAVGVGADARGGAAGCGVARRGSGRGEITRAGADSGGVTGVRTYVATFTGLSIFIHRHG